MKLPTMDKDAREWLRGVLRSHAGLELDDNDHVVIGRLMRLARREGFPTISELMNRLRGQPSAPMRQRLLEAMTNHETTFFRDPWIFTGLQEKILPALIAQRAARRTLTIWSAGCAAGQEPYSIAMLLAQHFPQLHGWNVRVLATDLSSAALERARAGIYSQIEINRGLPAQLMVRYFRRVDDGWQISDEIRRRVEFTQLNLLEPWPSLPAPDVIFLRNVLIYFGEATKRDVLRRMRRLLPADGYLILGGTETTFMVDDTFSPIGIGPATYYRQRADPT